MENVDKSSLDKALIKKALGYEYEEREIIVDKNGKNTGRMKVTKKHVPPDASAIKEIRALIQAGEL